MSTVSPAGLSSGSGHETDLQFDAHLNDIEKARYWWVMRLLSLTLLGMFVVISCGSDRATVAQGSVSAVNPDCEPSEDVSGGIGPSGDPGRRIEDIEYVLTGLRQTTDEDRNIGEMTDDPNFGASGAISREESLSPSLTAAKLMLLS